MALTYELRVVAGPLIHERFPLEGDVEVIIGQSGAIRLSDPLVSQEHAIVFRQGARWYIRDAGSLSGTVVNGRRLGEGEVRLDPGAVIEIGASEFRLHEVRERSLGATVAVGVVAAAIVVLWGVARWVGSEVIYEPHAMLGPPHGLVEVPLDFIRREGVDHRTLNARRVTDFDEDGHPELWLRRGRQEHVVETTPPHTWTSLGMIPRGCTDVPLPQRMPDLRCGGELYRFDGARYLPHSQLGVVAWMPPREGPPVGPQKLRAPPSAGPDAFRYTMVRDSGLSAFLRARGVDEPIHYLICEGAAPGVAPQVLTASGKRIEITPACIRAMQLEGPRRPITRADLPVALAFSPEAHRALLHDLQDFFAGSAPPFIAAPAAREYLAAVSTPPRQRANVRVSFRELNADLADPIAASGMPTPAERGRLIPLFGEEPAPRVTVETLTSDEQTFALGGCTRLRVQVTDWHCAFRKACTGGRTAVIVDEVGCSGTPTRVLDLPYSGTRARARTGEFTVVAQIDSVEAMAQTDLLRVRVGWQLDPE